MTSDSATSEGPRPAGKAPGQESLDPQRTRIMGRLSYLLAWFGGCVSIGIPGFVNAIGAVIAPFYGIIVIDYYVIRRGHLDVQVLFSTAPGSAYYYQNGWNRRALIAFAALFSLASVWVPALAALEGFAWLLGAGLGGACYYALMRGHDVSTAPSGAP